MDGSLEHRECTSHIFSVHPPHQPGGILISETDNARLTNKQLLVLLKRNKAIKETLGCCPRQRHDSWYARNINRDTLRNLSYDRTTKRLAVDFIHEGQERHHELRLKRVHPPMLDEFCIFLSGRP